MSDTFNPIEIREEFPQLKELVRGKKFCYLDNAATTLKPKCVGEKLNSHILYGASNIHRGVHFYSEKGTVEYEETRAKVKNFINAKSEREIIFTKGTTESINLVASSFGEGLKAGDEVIISYMEHHSNIVPWQILEEKKGIKLKVIPINDRGEIEMDRYAELLSEKTKLVSIVYISNSLGTINPIEKMIKMAHEVGAKFLVDAAQAMAHIPVDVQQLDADFLAFSGHKIYGPTGVGVLYGKEQILEQMPPYQGGGDMISSVSFEKTTYNDLPYKFEAGTPAIAEVIAMSPAIDSLMRWGLLNILKHENLLLDYAREKFEKLAGVRLIGTAAKKSGILSFVLENIHPHDIGTFADGQGVAIRTGHHCTQPVMQRFSVPATARASLGVYNTKEDIDQLVEAMIQVREFFS